MKSRMLFAALAGVTLVSATAPQTPAALQREARSNYPPCSRTVTDRCIQLYERGVRAPANLARNAAPAPPPSTAVASVQAPARVVHGRPTVRPAEDDIDVSYAGDVLQAPTAGRPGAPATRAELPRRVIVVREVRPAQPAAEPAQVRAEAPRPTRYAAVSPNVVRAAPRRRVSVKVRRAGERG